MKVINVSQREEYNRVRRYDIYCGVALCLDACSHRVSTPKRMQELFTLFIDDSLADSNDEVWENILAAGLTSIDVLGRDRVAALLPMLEGYMREGGKSSNKQALEDRRREGVVVLKFIGTLPRHLPSDNPKVVCVIRPLMDILHSVTPSRSVQRSVCECLVPLFAMEVMERHAQQFIDQIMTRLANEKTYGERMGAAFGLAGMIKGLKPAALKNYKVLPMLDEYIQDSKRAAAREGSLLACMRLFDVLEELTFEAYIAHVPPHLLRCFDSGNQDVVLAAQETSSTVMGVGVKMVLPKFLSTLDDTKCTKYLPGAMAFCAPKQLSSALPSIVSRLLEVMSDPHKKGQVAAQDALRSITMIRTAFVNPIDPPSLAIIVLILRKGLKSRETQDKKISQIMIRLSEEEVSQLMNEAYGMLQSPDALIREGYMHLLGELPEAFGPRFSAHLDDSFPMVLKGLADPLGPVRQAALRAGQAIISHFAKSNTDEIVTASRDGLIDQDWPCVSLSSVQLVGSLLMRLVDAQGEIFGEKEDKDECSREMAVVSTMRRTDMIVQALREERRDHIYAVLYLMHADVMSSVKDMAWRVWKACVANTPRMLSIIMSVLLDRMITESDLASHSNERQHYAGPGEALGGLVAKMSNAVLAEIIPLLQDRLQYDDIDVQKVCV